MRRASSIFLFMVLLSNSAARSSLAATSFAAGVSLGTVQNNQINEASGIAASRMNANVLWTHNDSGDKERVYAMTTTGTNLGTYTISDNLGDDWEDIAVGPGPVVGSQYLYIGAIGDNPPYDRATIDVFRAPEPVVSDVQSPVTTSLTGVAKLTFAYPDGPRDAESLFVDPQTSDIYIISKRESEHRIYRAAYPQATSGTTTLQYVAHFNDAVWITAADISPNGSEIIVRRYPSASGSLFVRPAGGTVADAFNSTPISISLRSETQGEAIGFDPQGWGFYTTSEGPHQPIYYYDRLPHGDFNHNGVVDAADYVVWRKSGGGTYQGGTFTTMRANFGLTAPGAGASLSAVPEPSVWFLVASCLAIFSFRMPRSFRHAIVSV